MPNRRSFLALSLSGAAAAAPAQQAAAPAKPLLRGLSTRGERVDLERLRGSVVLVFAWSTGCPVCLDKLPELRRNLDGWQGKPFVILALNQDRSVEDLRAYERLLESTGPMRPQMKLLWRGAAEHRDSLGELPRNAPTTFIIDKAGALAKTIRGRVPPELWDDIADLVF
jgi:thiol-disulfide isomerase/thioredoxin